MGLPFPVQAQAGMPVPLAFSCCPLGTVSFELRATMQGSFGAAMAWPCGAPCRGAGGCCWDSPKECRRQLAGQNAGFPAVCSSPDPQGFTPLQRHPWCPVWVLSWGWRGAVTVKTPTGTEPC